MKTSLLHLLNLVSPALPVGAYAYSQGQEYAVESGYLSDLRTAQQWIDGVMTHSLAGLDLPLLIRVHDAWQQQDIEKVKHWNQYLLACRETAEFKQEDQQMGRALMRLLTSLELPQAVAWPRQQPVCFVTAFAMAGVYWQIELPLLLQGFCWSWLENQAAAATKLIPLGQTDTQRLLHALMPTVEFCCEKAYKVADEDIGAGLPALALISAQHETQYSRLFRS